MSATTETLEALKLAQKQPDELVKAEFTTQGFVSGPNGGSGLNAYDLEPVAKTLYPVITPLRNMIPRVRGKGDNATRWRAITAINVSNMHMGVGEAARSGFIEQTVKDYTAPYRGIGLESFYTFEAGYSTRGFDDVRAREAEGLLRSFFIGEEFIILGGNGTTALAKPATPAGTAQTDPVGAFAAATAIKVRVVALTLDGLRRSSVAGGVPLTVARVPGDGSAAIDFNGGASEISDEGSVTPGSNSSSIYVSTTPVRGACGYAWYWGPVGNIKLGAITANASVLLTAAAAGTQAETVHSSSPADHSVDSYVFDGIMAQIADPTGNSYYQSLANPANVAAYVAQGNTGGTPLTSDGAGGVKEIDDALRSFWDNHRIGPQLMLVSAQELKNLSKLVIKNGGDSLITLNASALEASVTGRTLAAGTVIGAYLNPFSMDGGSMVKIMLHPNVPAGTIIFYSTEIPYRLSGINNILQIKARRNYYQIEWPLRTRRYEFGIYADELLQNYFPPAFGILTNIANYVA